MLFHPSKLHNLTIFFKMLKKGFFYCSTCQSRKSTGVTNNSNSGGYFTPNNVARLGNFFSLSGQFLDGLGWEKLAWVG